MAGTWEAIQLQTCVKPAPKYPGTRLLGFLLTVLHPVIYGLPLVLNEQPLKTATRKHPYIPPTSATHHTPTTSLPQSTNTAEASTNINDVFINALVQAGNCRQHAQRLCSRPLNHASSRSYSALQRKSQLLNVNQRRHFHKVVAIRPPLQRRTPLTREECLSMVDFYAEEYSTLSSNNMPIDPAMVFGPPPPGVRTPSLHHDHMYLQADNLYEQLMKKNEVEKVRRVLEHEACTHDEAWRAYEMLPRPGLSLLPDWSKHRLLQRLSITRKRDQVSMFRYLSVMDEMNALGTPLDKSEWTSAVAFAGHGYARISAASVESALLKWKEMEKLSKIQSGHVTFNILFDLATKAGKFVLAEKILKELESRKLGLCRFTRVGLIYYHGMKGDGDGVRRAYREFVEAGDIVDTVVMNCVIVSLVRAGELPAAEHVFERMKQMLHAHTGRQIPNLHWREPRDLGRTLDRAARKYKDNPPERQKLQEQQFLAPDPQTFAIFIEHHAKTTGEIMRISSLVTEMQHLGIPMEGRIFVRIFKGFAHHGGIRYTAWTKARLESVWDALLSALDRKLELITLDRWLIVWVVRAFEKCFGPEQTLIIWEEIRKRFKGDFRELSTVQDMLKGVLSNAVQQAGKM